MTEPIASLHFACAACGRMGMADPDLVMTIDVHRGPDGQPVVVPGSKEPLCLACARLKIQVHQAQGWPVPSLFDQPDYWRRAYYAE